MTASAPAAPGAMSEPVDPPEMLRYLEALGQWLQRRREELAELDAAVLTSTVRERLTADVMLSMALWQAVQDRYELLLATWDSGRVGRAERARLASLVWGRLDATLDRSLLARAGADAAASGLAVSLPEACRLSDALANQLRSALALDPALDQQASRVRDLRAGLERIRDQVALEPAPARPRAQQRLDELGTRVEDAAAKASRGGDVGGLLGPLENDAAAVERDLIVGAATRRETRGKVERARELRQDLEDRGQALRRLVQDCLVLVTPAPKYAVPDVDALGPVPNTVAALEQYLTRLEQVSRAMQVVQHAYSAAVAEHTDAAGLLGAYRVKAAALGVADEPVLTAVLGAAEAVLARRPSPLPVLAAVLPSCREALTWAIESSTPGPASSAGSQQPPAPQPTPQEVSR